MQDINNRRVIPTHSLSSTRLSRRLIFIFIGGVVILTAGLVFKIWPIANIIIKPEVYSLVDDFSIKVDLDIKEPSYTTSVIPGRIKSIGEDEAVLNQQNFIVKKINNSSLVYSRSIFDKVVKETLGKVIGDEAMILPETIEITEGDWQVSASGRIFYTTVSAQAKFYGRLPLDNWSREIAGVPVAEAQSILLTKTGVNNVKIELYPHFFSYISQKIPTNIFNIRFTLDTN